MKRHTHPFSVASEHREGREAAEEQREAYAPERNGNSIRAACRCAAFRIASLSRIASVWRVRAAIGPTTVTCMRRANQRHSWRLMTGTVWFAALGYASITARIPGDKCV